jgi:glycosyltransferase involved in cell wall biosynthesis
MTSLPFFSVVIPTYNRVRMLKQALDSVAGQTFNDYEIVVVDDASPDGTAEFLAGVPSERCRFVVNQANRGVSYSRNRGCAQARGEFIVFLDDDDAFRPGALASLYAKHLAYPEMDFLWGQRCIHGRDATTGQIACMRTDDWSALTGLLTGSQFLELVLQIATSSAFTIRRSLFNALGGFDEQIKVSEDRDLFIRLARSGNLGGAVDETLIDIDEHFNDSLSRTIGVRWVPTMDMRVINKHQDYLQLPEHRNFLNSYLLAVFCGFLQSGERVAAMRTGLELYRQHAVDRHVFRMYLRHAREFRELKALWRFCAALLSGLTHRRSPGPLDERTRTNSPGGPRP